MSEEAEVINSSKGSWELWAMNFHDAKRFFQSKGNIKTRSKLKKKWMDNFMQSLHLAYHTGVGLTWIHPKHRKQKGDIG